MLAPCSASHRTFHSAELPSLSPALYTTFLPKFLRVLTHEVQMLAPGSAVLAIECSTVLNYLACLSPALYTPHIPKFLRVLTQEVQMLHLAVLAIECSTV